MNTFDWSGIDEKYQWVATDANGKVYVYTEAPVWFERAWTFGASNECVLTPDRDCGGIMYWEESLQQRPQHATNEQNYQKITINGKEYFLAPV